jgi:hypothetical protein
MLRPISEVKPLGGKKATGQTNDTESLARLRAYQETGKKISKMPLGEERATMERQSFLALYPNASGFVEVCKSLGLNT